MFDQKRAAEFLVVAWCKDWTLGKYLNCVLECPGEELGQMVDRAVEAYPWLPTAWRAYKTPVRVFIGGAYPKLSRWLFSRPDDISRLQCAAQIQRLKHPKKYAAAVSDPDREEMIASKREEAASRASYRLSREAFKTNQRSAWSVCKA